MKHNSVQYPILVLGNTIDALDVTPNRAGCRKEKLQNLCSLPTDTVSRAIQPTKTLAPNAGLGKVQGARIGDEVLSNEQRFKLGDRWEENAPISYVAG